MKTSTRKNLKEFIENNRGGGRFPKGFTIEMFESMTDAQQASVIGSISYRLKVSIGVGMKYAVLTKAYFPKDGQFKFSRTVWERLIKIRDREAGITNLDDPTKTTIQWSEVNDTMKENFKKWVDVYGKNYDKNFNGELFDKLSDDIKLKFFYVMAKKFKWVRGQEVLNWRITAETMISKVKKLEINNEIQEAIINVVPVSSEDTPETVDDTPDDVKNQKRIELLKAACRRAKTAEKYKEVLENPLFNRDMLDIILKRFEKGTAFESRYSGHAKEVIDMVSTHPLTTTDDLVRIRKMKSKNSWNNNSSVAYASSSLNSALADKPDAPKDAIMQMVKLAQFDIKIKALKRTDLTQEDKDVIIDYTIRLHGHMPDQVKEIFKAAGEENLLNDPKVKKQIIDVLEKKYTKAPGWNTKPTGMAFLETVDEYGWLDDLPEKTKLVMGGVISTAYNKNILSKERIKKIIGSLKGDASFFLIQLYQETNDADFLPKETQDVFLF